LPVLVQTTLKPIPANAKITVAAIPMGINPTAFSGSHHLLSLHCQEQRGDGKDQTQSGECRDRTNFGAFDFVSHWISRRAVPPQFETVRYIVERFAGRQVDR